MISFPPCKINLGLNIVSKRPDGYHDLVTCFYPMPWNDILEIIPASDLAFSHSGIFIPGDVTDNLCLKAYHLLKKEFDVPAVHIHLHKIIPMGAGLGGGSSDAAWTLRMLDSIFALKLSPSQLQSYASSIGSDCAFFIQDKPMIGKGRGEVLEETTVSLKNKFIVLVKPDIHVSTAEAYSNVKPEIPQTDLRQIVEQSPIQQWKNFLKNDFEDSVFQKFPVIGKIKKTLYEEGALYASMSGSGSSVFGIFESPVDLTEKLAGDGHVSYTSRV
jgi:4-diphosphocytidyl-2-C-methyl-D-erythritol kinase